VAEFLAFTVLGIVTGSTYAIAASGLVVTYTASGIFNFAHGAIGMFMAFTYWELLVNRGLPTPIALILVVLVLAPLLGALIERTLMRNLQGSSAGTSLVVTIGLLVALVGAAQSIWPPATREVPQFFGFDGFRAFDIFVTWHQLVTLAVAGAVAVGLRLLLFRTRTGTAMRAVVDARDLAALNGARPARISMLSWAIGASLASLAGILLAPTLSLDVIGLTLLVVVAYAAAMVGRLKSLPLTFLGAMILGLGQNYLLGYQTTLINAINLDWLSPILEDLRPALPALLLFALLLAMPEARLRAGRLAGARAPRVPGRIEAVVGAVLLVAAVAVLSGFLSNANRLTVGHGFSIALIMLSLVLLTGYGGQVSLAQMSFVGLGAFAMGAFGGDGSPLGLLAAVLLTAPVGALVALPALRLQGLYLALATMAFALFMEHVVFPNESIFGIGGSVQVGRLDLPFISFDSEQAYVVLLAVAFALMGLVVLALRRGAFGRRLAAMRDSPAASTTLGLNLTRTKLAVFTISAGMAGLAGALYGGLREVPSATEFIMFQSLPILLAAVIGGINSVTGALIGGMSLALLPVLAGYFPELTGLTPLLVGLSAMTLGRNPNGMAWFLFKALGPLAFWRRRGIRPAGPAPVLEAPPREVTRVAAAAD
jgi:branched-chain amino acid transport system permease protein